MGGTNTTEMLIKDKWGNTYRTISYFPGVVVVPCPIFNLNFFSNMCQDLGHTVHTGLHSCRCRDFTELESAGLCFLKLFWVFSPVVMWNQKLWRLLCNAYFRRLGRPLSPWQSLGTIFCSKHSSSSSYDPFALRHAEPCPLLAVEDHVFDSPVLQSDG